MSEQNNQQRTAKPRRHNKGFRVALLLAVVTGIGATAVWANNHRLGAWDSAERMQHRIERLTKHLDLSEDQSTRIEAIMTTSRTSAEPYRVQLSTLRGDLRTLIEADEYYEDQVRIQLETRAAALVELMVIGTRTMHDVLAELTPEQRTEADAMMERFIEKAGPRRFGRHRHGNTHGIRSNSDSEEGDS